MEDMNWLDVVIVSIMSISILISILRGFVKESITLCTWVGAAFLSYMYGPAIGELIVFIQTALIRTFVGCCIVFISTIILGSTINYILSKSLKFIGHSPVDRLGGAVFGFLRGGLVIVSVVFFTSSTPIAEQKFWQESVLMPRFVNISANINDRLPKTVKNSIAEVVDTWAIT